MPVAPGLSRGVARCPHLRIRVEYMVVGEDRHRHAQAEHLLRHRDLHVHPRPGVPHIHAWHGDERAVVDIASGQFLAGGLQPRQARLVRTWVELHLTELIEAWERASEGEPPGTIEALP
jgi:uncharacterized protein DUF4160